MHTVHLPDRSRRRSSGRGGAEPARAGGDKPRARRADPRQPRPIPDGGRRGAVAAGRQRAVDELKDYIENGNITNSVNMPAVSVPRSGKTRITIIHKNVTNVISRITAIVAEENINIDNMVNKSRGEYAYTMLDTDTEVSNDAITAISSQDFAIRVRVIK